QGAPPGSGGRGRVVELKGTARLEGFQVNRRQWRVFGAEDAFDVFPAFQRGERVEMNDEKIHPFAGFFERHERQSAIEFALLVEPDGDLVQIFGGFLLEIRSDAVEQLGALRRLELDLKRPSEEPIEGGSQGMFFQQAD